MEFGIGFMIGFIVVGLLLSIGYAKREAQEKRLHDILVKKLLREISTERKVELLDSGFTLGLEEVK